MATKKVIRKQGIFFMIDALIAALIMISALLMITSSYVSEKPRASINHLSYDLLNVLSELTVGEVNNSFVLTLIDNETITNLNNSIIEQAGIFWAESELDLASQLLENVTNGVFPEMFGYSFAIDSETVFSTEDPVTSSLAASKKVVSGIQKSKPVKGYIAKASATTVMKNTNMVISFSPSGAGWKGSAADPGRVVVTKVFEISPDLVLGAKSYLSLHLDRGSPDWTIVDINEGACEITRDNMSLAPGSEGVFRVFDLPHDCFVEGNNTITLDLRNLGYNAHIHPGTFFVIKYNQTDSPELLYSDHSERLYFDNVLSSEGGGVSGSGPWTIKEFHIPSGATDVSVAFQVAGRNIVDYTGSCTPSRRFWGWGFSHCKKDFDYMVFLNDDVPMDSDGAPDEDPLYVYSSEDTAPLLVEGTNVISVYFNNYEDIYWGEGDEIIYSDPVGDPEGSSYVEVNYSLESVLPYGVIEVRVVEEFNGTPDPQKDTNFSFPMESEGISSVYVHPVEQYSYIAEVYSDTGYPPGNLVFRSPSSRAVPSEIYVPEDTLDDSALALNYVRLRETTENDVLPNSTIDYGFYVKGTVGYGGVFSAHATAVEDAVDRLSDVLGMYINASDIVIQETSMSDVPSMWGPAVFEVRVWT